MDENNLKADQFVAGADVVVKTPENNRSQLTGQSWLGHQFNAKSLARLNHVKKFVKTIKDTDPKTRPDLNWAMSVHFKKHASKVAFNKKMTNQRRNTITRGETIKSSGE